MSLGILGAGIAMTVALAPCAGCAPKSGASDPASAIATLRLASIDGKLSGREWLRVRGRSIEATGLVGNGFAVYQSSDGPQTVVELIVPEQLPGTTLYHNIPLYIPSDARVVRDGERVDLSLFTDFEKAGSPLADLSGPAEATFTLTAGRPVVQSLSVRSLDEDWPAEVPDGGAPPPAMIEAPGPAPDELWLNIAAGETVELAAYAGGGYSESGTGIPTTNWSYFYVPDRLGDAVAFHAIPVSGSLGPSDTESASGPSPVNVRFRLEDGRFVALE